MQHSAFAMSPALPDLEKLPVPVLLDIKKQLSATVERLPKEGLSYTAFLANLEHVNTMLAAKQGFDRVVADRLAAQFSMATNLPGGLAVELYETKGWDAAVEALLKEHDFVPQMGPVCLWSETEGGWWVHDFGWADSAFAAAGYPAQALLSSARAGESWMLWSQVQAQALAAPAEA